MEKGDSLSFKTKADFVNLFWFHVEIISILSKDWEGG